VQRDHYNTIMEDEKSNYSNYTTPPPEHLEKDSIIEQIIIDDSSFHPHHLMRHPSSRFEGSVVSGNNSFIQIADSNLADMLKGALDVDEMLLSDGSDEDDSDSGGSQSKHSLLLESFQRRAIMENAFKLHNSVDGLSFDGRSFDGHSSFSSSNSVSRKDMMMMEKEETIIEVEEANLSFRTVTSNSRGIAERTPMDSSSHSAATAIELETTAFVQKSMKVKPASFKPTAFKPHKTKNTTDEKQQKKKGYCSLLMQNKKRICCWVSVLFILLGGIFILLFYKKNIMLRSGEKTVSVKPSDMTVRGNLRNSHQKQ